MSAVEKLLDVTLGQFSVTGTDARGVSVQHHACGFSVKVPYVADEYWPTLLEVIQVTTDHLEQCKTADGRAT